jgi:hypothetical protein
VESSPEEPPRKKSKTVANVEKTNSGKPDRTRPPWKQAAAAAAEDEEEEGESCEVEPLRVQGAWPSQWRQGSGQLLQQGPPQQ